MFRCTLLLAACLLPLCSVLPASAQKRGAAFALMPEAGWYMPQRDLSSTSRLPAAVASGPALGLRAEAPLPVRGTALRGGFSWVESELTRPRLAEGAQCGDVCPIIPGEFERVSGARIYLALADLLVRGPRLGPVQPYLAAGGGFKYYDFAQADLSGEFASAFAEDETAPMSHLGIGLNFSVGSHTAVVEAGNYSSRSSTHGRQDDIALTAGLRIRVPR